MTIPAQFVFVSQTRSCRRFMLQRYARSTIPAIPYLWHFLIDLDSASFTVKAARGTDEDIVKAEVYGTYMNKSALSIVGYK